MKGEIQFRNTGPSVTVSYPVVGSPPFKSYPKPRLDTEAARTTAVVPAPAGSPAPVTVQNDQCYGSNTVSWSAVGGATEFHLESSPNSNFSGATLLANVDGSGTGLLIDVPATRYVRVRACTGVQCGTWQAAPTPATYFAGCP